MEGSGDLKGFTVNGTRCSMAVWSIWHAAMPAPGVLDLQKSHSQQLPIPSESIPVTPQNGRLKERPEGPAWCRSNVESTLLGYGALPLQVAPTSNANHCPFICFGTKCPHPPTSSAWVSQMGCNSSFTDPEVFTQQHSAW